HRDQFDALCQLVALEARSGSFLLRQLRPGLVWFQLGIDGLADPSVVMSLRWREWSGSSLEAQNYPAPVWRLDVPQWPVERAGAARAKPILTAWWLASDRPLPGTEFDRDPNGGAQTVRVDDNQTVRIEDIRREEHLVEVQPGAPPQVKSCL